MLFGVQTTDSEGLYRCIDLGCCHVREEYIIAHCKATAQLQTNCANDDKVGMHASSSPSV